MFVRIYKPAKTAMQSGRAKTDQWLLEAVPTHRKSPENLMGWVSSADTFSEIKLKFDNKETAIAKAEKNGWAYEVIAPHSKTVRPKSYADNFAFGRIQ
jgi:hypothetical protein